jgi:ribose/xylose/arabinose/galactoside ABC-type transport system permease subunit
VALSSVVAARVTEALWTGAAGAIQPYLAVIAGVATGAVCGLYSGLLIVLLRLPPFIVTLGMMGFYRGLAKWAAESQQVRGHAAWIADWVQAVPPPGLRWAVVAPSVWVMLLAAGGVAALMQWTVLGRRAVAIGSNEEAARRAAVPIGRVKVLVYCVSGVLVGLAGVVKFARLGGSGDPTSAMGLELDAVAAVVIGGGSLAGGSASVVGTLCGALLMALLDNRCTALGWPNYVQQLVVGHIIVLAVALDRWRRGRMG